MKKVNDSIFKTIFIILSVLFATPSIIYLIKHKTVFGFSNYYRYLLNGSTPVLQAVVFICIFIMITVVYLVITKKQEKIFKNFKSIILFVMIISCIFAIIMPFTSTDVYYYMGTR